MFLKTMLSDSRTYIMFALILLLYTLFFASKKSYKIMKVFIIFTVICNVAYLVWRILFSLPVRFGIISMVLGVILLLAELTGFWQSMIFRFLFWKPYQGSEYPPAEFEEPPVVDVFIATYNESAKILKKTVTGCLNLDYPQARLNIYICDDGRRTEIKQLAEELGVQYITRENNAHAKAGNINNALSQTNGEFILLLDADMVPKSSFLKKTIGYCTDERMGFIQTPQVFYNPDPFQFNLKLDKSIPNEQDFFMMDIEGGRDNYNAVLHVGTNAVFRRSAIEDIGGIPTGTITEDMATGMLLQAKGYHSKFVKEVLCTGLSVESFSDLIKQRERWCRGNIQVTKKWNPLKMKGLSFAQRLIYIDGFVYWFFGVQKMIYIICPLIYLIFGTVILDATIYDLLLFWLPSFIASVLTFRALVKKSRSITWSHIYEVAMAPFLSLSAVVEALFSKPIPFKVTPKGTYSEKTTISFRAASPHMVLLACTILGWTLSFSRFYSGSSFLINSTLINIAWSLYNAVAIVISIFVCLERPRKRGSDRLVTDEAVTLSLNEAAFCKIVDISEVGAKVECDGTGDFEDRNAEAVSLSSKELGNLSGNVVWKKNDKNKKSYGIKFDQESNDLYSRIVKYISDRSRGYHDNK